uniref:RRM domain-containing protein n=1 Tax=Heligmosomoides polygyrus TaxID=6339 RepID=A0A183FLI2_HELPZ
LTMVSVDIENGHVDMTRHQENLAEIAEEQEYSTECKDESSSNSDEELETAEEDGKSEEEGRCSERGEPNGWENVGTDMIKKADGKLELGNPFRCNSPFGGFSRTNAALYYQDEGNSKKAERQPVKHRSSTFLESGQMETQAELLSRRDFSTLDRTDLNMIDEQYVEYYEYLSQGIQRLLESGINLDADCESRGSSNSFQQPSICRALKSKLYYQYNLGPEIYSRKVFVGGLPIDIEEDELVETFARFGSLVVDWPNKNETKSYYPPKG